MNFYKLYRLLNEYGENLVNFLITKFMKENPNLSPEIIRRYIERFERIKNNLENKDVNTYSWKDLENTVDGYRSKERIKAGRLDATTPDANLLYNQNGTRIYLGRDKKSCIKYGNGYTFCISARGEDNMYDQYRFSNKGTPYFIFNDNLPSSDNRHLMVLFVYKTKYPIGNFYTNKYALTLADNQGEKTYQKLEKIIKDYPWISPISSFINDDHNLDSEEIESGKYIGKGYEEPESIEELEYILKKEFENKEENLTREISKNRAGADWFTRKLLQSLSKENLKEFSEDKNVALGISLHIGDGWSEKSHIFKNYKDSFVNGVSRIISKVNSFFLKNKNEAFNRLKETIKDFFREQDDLNLGVDSEDERKILIKKIEDYVEKNKSEIIKNLSECIEKSKLLTAGKIDIDNDPTKGFYFGNNTWGYLLTKIEIENKPLFYVYVINLNESFQDLLNKKSKDIENLNNLRNEYRKNLNYLRTLNKEELEKIIEYYNSSNRKDLFDTIKFYLKS